MPYLKQFQWQIFNKISIKSSSVTTKFSEKFYCSNAFLQRRVNEKTFVWKCWFTVKWPIFDFIFLDQYNQQSSHPQVVASFPRFLDSYIGTPTWGFLCKPLLGYLSLFLGPYFSKKVWPLSTIFIFVSP